MSDDGTTDVGQTAPETPASQPEPTRIDDQIPLDDVEQAAPEPVEEFEEIDWEDGKKYKVPKPLKDGVLRHKDYTQKTQSVAEHRRQLEAYAQQVAQREQVGRQHVHEMGQLALLDQHLSQYARMTPADWSKLENEDPFKAASMTREYTMLRDQRNNLAYQVQAREQQRIAESQRNFATAYQRTNEQLARDLPHWNQDHADKLRGFAKEIGLTDQQIAQWAIHAPAVKLLDQAYLGRQLAQARQTAAQTAEPRIEPTPLRKVSGSGAKPAFDPATADMDSYAAWFKKRQATR